MFAANNHWDEPRAKRGFIRAMTLIGVVTFLLVSVSVSAQS
jgi:hypothetical protein